MKVDNGDAALGGGGDVSNRSSDMSLKNRAVTAGIRQTRRKPARFQGYIQVKGRAGQCTIPVGPWRNSKAQALTDAKTAERVHRERRGQGPDG